MLYRLQNIQRKHGDRTVLSIDELDIEPHQIYTLIGPNGAGKTSLLKILAFLDTPSSGSLYFQDRQISFDEKHLYALRRQVVLLDQDPIMFTGSVWDNVEFGLQVRRVPMAERRRRIEETLEMVGMESFARYNAQGLSGGETKRVALARALVLQPEVLLCDEPTANVDNENQEIILQIIEKINKEQDVAVIFSTHFLSQGQRLADQTLLLQNGSLSDIVSENIYRVTVVGRRENLCICQLTGQFFLEIPQDVFPVEGNVAKLHIDPHQIIFNPTETNPAEGNIVSGHVTDLSQDSGRIRAVIDAGIKLTMILEMEQYRSEKTGIGEKVQVLIPYTSMHCSKIHPAL